MGNTLIMKTKSHGGSRKGAGRPKGEPTKVLAYRVPVKSADKAHTAIQGLLKKLIIAALLLVIILMSCTTSKYGCGTENYKHKFSK